MSFERKKYVALPLVLNYGKRLKCRVRVCLVYTEKSGLNSSLIDSKVLGSSSREEPAALAASTGAIGSFDKAPFAEILSSLFLIVN